MISLMPGSLWYVLACAGVRSVHESFLTESLSMAGLVLRTLIVALGLWLASVLVPGITVHGVWTVLGAALLLGLVNALIRPLVVLITFPITILTLGLFLLVVNAGMLALVAWVFDDFTVAGFWPALWGAVIIGVTSWLASWFVGPRRRLEVIVVHHRP